MSMFQHEAKQFKFDVLREVSKRAFEGSLNPNTPDELAHLLIPTNTAHFRCCIYKEREIIRERTKIACFKDPKTGKEVEIDVKCLEAGRRFEDSFVDIESMIHMDITIED